MSAVAMRLAAQHAALMASTSQLAIVMAWHWRRSAVGSRQSRYRPAAGRKGDRPRAKS